jgi:hypothetical protein
MRDFSGEDNKGAGSLAAGFSAGGALRHEILNKITPILLECNSIPDSNKRLLIQACCLDVVTSLEDVIKHFGLDECQSGR